MSCEDEFFNKECDVIKETWGQTINDFENIDLIIYKGTTDSTRYDKQEKTLYVRCEDDLEHTYKKTYYALNYINRKLDYDYIFRTNTATYVNINLLNEFVQGLDNDEITWATDLYSLSCCKCPYPLYLFGRGNGLLLSKSNVNVLLKEGFVHIYMTQENDDGYIGNVLNSHWIKENRDYRHYLKSMTHCWYKTVNAETNNNHPLSNYNYGCCEQPDFDLLKKCITIQVKVYPLNNRNKELELIHYKELHNIFINNTDDDIQNTIDFINDYSKNPPVFIGSILGYIDYKTWDNIPYTQMYNLQVTHKADDDPYKGKDLILY